MHVNKYYKTKGGFAHYNDNRPTLYTALAYDSVISVLTAYFVLQYSAAALDCFCRLVYYGTKPPDVSGLDCDCDLVGTWYIICPDTGSDVRSGEH